MEHSGGNAGDLAHHMRPRLHNSRYCKIWKTKLAGCLSIDLPYLMKPECRPAFPGPSLTFIIIIWPVAFNQLDEDRNVFVWETDVSIAQVQPCYKAFSRNSLRLGLSFLFKMVICFSSRFPTLVYFFILNCVQSDTASQNPATATR